MPSNKPHDKTSGNPAVRAFLRTIGRKGGRKSQRHPDRPLLQKKAAEARWRKQHPEPKKV